MGQKPKINEVMRWFVGWKGFFPQDILDQESIVVQLVDALIIIEKNKTIKCFPSILTKEKLIQKNIIKLPCNSENSWRILVLSLFGTSFKSLIEDFTLIRGIKFYPKP